VTSRTLSRGSLEIDVLQASLQRRWAVAINASHPSVNPEQWKRGLRVVEPGEFLPRFGGVTGFAARHCPIGTLRLHPLAELALVRIHVAGRARPILKLVFDRHRRIRGHGFVTIRAQHCDVRAG